MKKTLEQFKNMSKKNKIILVSILASIILIFGATTFAFFSSTINGESQPLSVQAGILILEFNDAKDSNIRNEEINLNNEIEKDMVIINQGTQDSTATIMWNELENTYLDKSLKYTVKQTVEYDKDAVVDTNTLEYNIEVPEAGIYVPRSEASKKTALTRGLLIPAGKKIYYRVTITYNHLDGVDQTADLEAKLTTSFIIEEGEQLEPFTITGENRSFIGYTGVENEELVIPSTYQDENGKWYKVIGIGERAFQNCSHIKSITISNGIKSIGNYAFNNCTRLTSINVNDNNENFKSLDGVLFTKDGKTLVQYPVAKTGFYTVPDNVTNIGRSSFYGCYSLTSITLSDSLNNIEDYAFYGCRNLTSITIPERVTSIGDSAFCDCRSITSITLPDNITSIEHQAFANCSNLVSITISNNVTSIGVRAFLNCNSLTSINIPESVISINGDAFWGCHSLTSINVNENNRSFKSIDGVVFTQDGKTLIKYPHGKSGSYTIPDNVTSIGDYALWECMNLTSITIPENVTSIGVYAFHNCSNLTSVIYKDVTYTSKSAFTTAFTTTSGNTINNNAFSGTGLST